MIHIFGLFSIVPIFELGISLDYRSSIGKDRQLCITLIDLILVYLMVICVLRLAYGIGAVNQVLAVPQAVIERVVTPWPL